MVSPHIVGWFHRTSLGKLLERRASAFGRGRAAVSGRVKGNIGVGNILCLSATLRRDIFK